MEQIKVTEAYCLSIEKYAPVVLNGASDEELGFSFNK